MLLKSKYSWQKFEKLIGIQSNAFLTYIVNGVIYYVGNSGDYERINRRALDYAGIVEIEELAEEEGQEVVVIFLGKNHTEKALGYLKHISKSRAIAGTAYANVLELEKKLPEAVYQDILKRCNDWLESNENGQDDDYIKRQLEYGNRYIAYSSQKGE